MNWTIKTLGSISRAKIAKARFLLALVTCVILGLALCGLRTAQAQMIQTSTPFTTVSDSYYENFGVNFGFQLNGGRGAGSRIVGLGPGGNILPNVTFTQGGAASAIPPFGGFDPNSQAHFGWLNSSGSGQYGLGLSMGKGSSRTLTSTVPTVVGFNGTTSSIFSGQMRPFVTGFFPVVGQNAPLANGYSPYGNRYAWMLDRLPPSQHGYSDYELNGSRRDDGRKIVENVSSASTAAKSVSAIKAEREQRLAAEHEARLAKIYGFIEKAEAFEAEGKPARAASYYRSALQAMKDRPEFNDLWHEIGPRYQELLGESIEGPKRDER
ncbi:MAG TPA: hypothetical protein PKD64_10495 [Pirellulaceae bacterium]|nr:hypothetical protein [Pirellulaceae bacterium]HMO92609.1 hypothetical protein [Pirellulaceae bacterium]HMP70698.1 hypothetical protein [Pirellulaceae bacterium]